MYVCLEFQLSPSMVFIKHLLDSRRLWHKLFPPVVFQLLFLILIIKY
jgi:hypothetical protein